MAKVRNLGSIGVITDLNPNDLPPNAWTMAINVRFTNGRVNRGMVFREWFSPAPTNIQAVFSFPAATGIDTIIAPCADGTIAAYTSATYTDVSDTALAPLAVTKPWTHCYLSGVSYLANTDLPAPMFYDSGTGDYDALTNWPASTTCAALRKYKDFLVALDIVKSGVEYRRMVWWSEPVLAGAVPTSWDVTIPGAIAGDNVLAQERDYLVDGLELGGLFYIYSPSTVYRMAYTGDDSIMAVETAFSGGILTQNCVVEVSGRHFVFGQDDIYIHDGIAPQSIADGRVKDFIFGSLNRTLASKAYVVHQEQLKEVHFCYVSTDDEVGFTDATFCNRAAVYNYASDTWAFLDLPNTVGATYASPSAVTLWSDLTGSWAEQGGSWSSMADSARKALVTISRSLGSQLTDDWCLVGDTINASRVNLPLAAETFKRALLRKDGIDLDEMDDRPHTYKVLSRAVPQQHSRDIRGSTVWRFGAYDYDPNQITWSSPVTFDPSVDYKVDRESSGRTLAIEITQEVVTDFSLSGVDLVLRANQAS